jgi:O-antigen ligase
LFKNYKKKDYYQQLSKLLLIILGAVFLIVAIINIPMLGYKGDFNAGKTFKERANLKNSEEAAISSRWSLLAPMSQEILKSPIIGHGFGKEITYISSDPRVLENNSSGEYTSSAFEWGWLSIWLKMGFLGLLAYLWLFYRIIKDAFISNYNKVYIWALGLSLLTLMIVNFFTPYLNHPLGIIYLLIVSLIVSSYKLNCLKK